MTWYQKAIVRIVNRYLFESDKPKWREWLTLGPGAQQELSDLYGLTASRFGDWLILAC